MTASPAAAYRTVADLEGVDTPIVWRTPPRVAFDASGLSSGETSIFTDEIRAAVSVWTSVDCAAIDMGYVGTDADAPIVIRLVDDWAARGFASDAPGTTELAFVLSEDGQTEIVAADIYLDATHEWHRHPEPDIEHARDLRAVLVHELGHALGLAHTCEPGAGVLCSDIDETASLYPYYVGPSQAELADDDIAGACALYPAPAGSTPPERIREQCATDDTCAVGQWCIEGVCQRDLRYGGECERGLQCLSRVCVEEMTGSDTGVCTYECAGDDDCPASTICADVEGDDPRRVCAPVMPTSGCSVTAPSPGSSLGLAAIAGTLLLMLITIRRRRHALLVPTLLALIATGCGESHPGDPDAEAVLDASPSPLDAYVPERDAGFDAGAVDAFVATDAGDPPTPDAGPPPPECDPGETRVADCGFCGTQTQECDSAGAWQPTSECLLQGECAAGSVEEATVALCETGQRICLSDCSWSPWEQTVPPGICEAGDVRLAEDGCPSGEIREETCNSTCSDWTSTACSDPCGGTARTTPEWKQEVCVSAGPFIRGSVDYLNTQPVAEVYVSSFYIDRYPVTNGRYRECPSAICPTPIPYTEYADPDRSEYPITSVTAEAAATFCEWDGGRRLPTEAEWEKALRGPAPRDYAFPWGDDAPRCDLIFMGDCGTVPTPSTALDPYNALPGSRSYYGTYQQYGGVHELVSDLYDGFYYSDPSSLDDPQGPTSSEYVTRRGVRRGSAHIDLAWRGFLDPTGRDGFRCARSAP